MFDRFHEIMESIEEITTNLINETKTNQTNNDNSPEGSNSSIKNGVITSKMVNYHQQITEETETETDKKEKIETTLNGDDDCSSESDALVIDENKLQQQHFNPYFNESLYELSQQHHQHYHQHNNKNKNRKVKPGKLREYAQYLGLQPSVQFKCSKCGRAGFESLITLNEHIIQCTSNSSSGNNTSDKNVHENLIKNCVSGGSGGDDNSTLHTNSDDNYSSFKLTRKVFLCSPCGTYYENWNLYLHMLEVHKRYVCLYCLGMFSILNDLCLHIEIKHNLLPNYRNNLTEFFNFYKQPCYLICCDCNKLFSEQDNFFYHKCSNKNKKIHNKNNNKQIQPINHITGDSTILSITGNTLTTTTTATTTVTPVINKRTYESSDSEPEFKGFDLNDESDDNNNNSDDNSSDNRNFSSANLTNTDTDDNNSNYKEMLENEIVPQATTLTPPPTTETVTTTTETITTNTTTTTTTTTTGPPIETRKVPKLSLKLKLGSFPKIEQQILTDNEDSDSDKEEIEEEEEVDDEEDQVNEEEEEIDDENEEEDNNNNHNNDDNEEDEEEEEAEDEEFDDNNLEDNEEIQKTSQWNNEFEEDFDEKIEPTNTNCFDNQTTENPLNFNTTNSNDSIENSNQDTNFENWGKIEENFMVQNEFNKIPNEFNNTIPSNQHETDLTGKYPKTDDNRLDNENSGDMFWDNNEETGCPEIQIAGPDISIVELELEQPLDKFDLRLLIQKMLSATCLTCIYCNHARKIAVNAKQLALHAISEHRYSAIVSSITAEELIPENFVQRIKDGLNNLDENLYFNLEEDLFESLSPTSPASIPPLPPHTKHLFECFQCRFKTTVHKELYLHNRKLHAKNLLLCIMCKSNFYSYSELLCHLCPGLYILDHDLKFRCCLCLSTRNHLKLTENCNENKTNNEYEEQKDKQPQIQEIPSAFRLMVHLRKYHNMCDVCFELCNNQYKLSNHIWKHKLYHFCYRCGISYRNKPDITRHLFWKHGTESVLCKKCLQKKWPHVYHFCIPPQNFSCDECSFLFSSANALKVHKRLHSNFKPHECLECNEKFISKKLLKKHKLYRHEKKLLIFNQNASIATDSTTLTTTNLITSTNSSSANTSEIDVVGNDTVEVGGVTIASSSDVTSVGGDNNPVVEEIVKKPKIDVYDLPELNLSESDSSDESDNDDNSKKIDDNRGNENTSAVTDSGTTTNRTIIDNNSGITTIDNDNIATNFNNKTLITTDDNKTLITSDCNNILITSDDYNNMIISPNDDITKMMITTDDDNNKITTLTTSDDNKMLNNTENPIDDYSSNINKNLNNIDDNPSNIYNNLNNFEDNRHNFSDNLNNFGNNLNNFSDFSDNFNKVYDNPELIDTKIDDKLTVIENIWDNFKNYQAKKEEFDNLFHTTATSLNNTEQKSNDNDIDDNIITAELALRDHDYIMKPADVSFIEMTPDLNQSMDHDYCSPKGTRVSSPNHTNDNDKQLTSGLSPAATVNNTAVDTTTTAVTINNKKIVDDNNKKKLSSDDNSSDSSDSDSSCSCGSNCSCSSSSSNSDDSTTADSSNSDSSTEEGRRRQQIRRDKRSTKRNMKKLTDNKPPTLVSTTPAITTTTTVETSPQNNNTFISVVDDNFDIPIHDSDLETTESETDEEFYDKEPHKIAKKLFEEKRKQLIDDMKISINGSLVDDNSTNSNIINESRSNTPSNLLVVDDNSTKIKSKKSKLKSKKKKKKKKKENRSDNRFDNNIPLTNDDDNYYHQYYQQQQQELLQRQQPAIAPITLSRIPPTLSSSGLSSASSSNHLSVVKQEFNLSGINQIYSSNTPPTTTTSTPINSQFDLNHQSNQDNDQNSLRASKRRRVPNKFYGYSSDEDQEKTTPVTKWRRLEPATPPPPQQQQQPQLVPPLTIKNFNQPKLPPISIRTSNLNNFNQSSKRQNNNIPPLRLKTNRISSPTILPTVFPNNRQNVGNTGSSRKFSGGGSNTNVDDDNVDDDDDDDEDDDNSSSDDDKMVISTPPITTNFDTNRTNYLPNVNRDALYCYCKCPYDEVSEMIGCDSKDCAIEWFHFECVGIMVPPKGHWYCPECRKKRQQQRHEFLKLNSSATKNNL